MPNSIRVALLPSLLPENWQQATDTAVVVDALRFTTTACQALAAGAARLSVAASVEVARSLSACSQPAGLLCGERHCRPIAGFDLGNSPSEYQAAIVGGRDLVFTTTNGTLAVEAARPAKRMLLGGLVNCEAVAQAIAGESVWILCSGTDGEVAGEDVLAAGAMIAAAQAIDPTVELGNDAARLARDSYQPFAASNSGQRQRELYDAFMKFRGGRQLLDNGYHADIEFAAQVGVLRVVPTSLASSPHSFVAS